MAELSKTIEKKLRRKSIPCGQPKLLNIPRNWFHQGITYMDRTEMVFRIVSEFCATLVLWLIFSRFGKSFYQNAIMFIMAGAIVHTLCWVLISNFWAGILFTFPRLNNPGEAATCEYLNRMGERLRKSNSISAVAVFGSVSRGQWHDRSDIDLRLLRRPGVINGIMAVFVTMRERMLACLARQPIDMYLADDIAFLKKMREDEPPLFLVRRDKRVEQAYPASQQVKLKSLK